MKKIIKLEKVFNQAVADLKESFEGLKAELISVDKPELIMHDGKRLKKVEREAEEGDYVRFVKDFGFGTKSGEFYEVIKDTRFLDDNGIILGIYGWGGAKSVEGVYEVVYETVNREAKVGERILITNPGSTFGQYDKGDIFTVASEYKDYGVKAKELGEWYENREGHDVYISHYEYEVIVEPEQVPIIKELTANQQRAELIEKAKKFVEENTKYDSQTIMGDFGMSFGLFAVHHRFVVNKKKRTVVCLLTRIDNEGRVFKRGIAKCMPNEVFNEWTGKVIALARALEIDVPEEFLNAVQPTKKVVGMVVDWDGRVRKIAEEAVFGETCQLGSDTEHFGKIINDTNAIYEEVASQ